MKPTREDLYRLYVDGQQTTRQIGATYGVAHITVSRWLASYGIPVRGSGVGLAARGITPPTRDELHALVHVERLSYREIADRYGVDFTAVPHWLTKHGIPKPTVWETRYRGAPPTLPTPDEIRRRLADGETIRQIAASASVTRRPIMDICAEHGIETKPSGWDRSRRFPCADGHKVRSSFEQSVDDWLHAHGLDHEYEPQYPFDRRYRADFLVGATYIEVWGTSRVDAYDERRRWKAEKCRAEGIDLIEISHQAFEDETWGEPLQRLLEDALS